MNEVGGVGGMAWCGKASLRAVPEIHLKHAFGPGAGGSLCLRQFTAGPLFTAIGSQRVVVR